MAMSDRIETFIMELLKDEEDWVEIGRNELASIFSCVPSQINYVIKTRFSPQRGYIVESRRGGGGYLKIRRVEAEDEVTRVISSIGDKIDMSDARALITYLYSSGRLSQKEANIMLSAVSDNSLDGLEEKKNNTRATILKNMLLITQ